MYVTFYSYKGGVGRTLALANIACLFAEDRDHPQRVLLWDFDLEAPGLHRLFPPREKRDHPGFVDLVHAYAATGRVNSVRDYIYRSHIDDIDVLPAGTVTSLYCNRLQSIAWPALFGSDPTDNGPFFSDVILQLNELDYDYIFIDSRTGLNDHAGICTQVLSDIIVMVFRLTDQNIDGLSYLVPSVQEQLESRNKRSVAILPVVSQALSTASEQSRDRLKKAREIFNTNRLPYIRFDSDLSNEEALFALKQEQDKRWPTPAVVGDYKRLCDLLRRKNRNDTKTLLRTLQHRLGLEDRSTAFAEFTTLLKRRPKLRRSWLFARAFAEPAQKDEIDGIAKQLVQDDNSNEYAHEWIAWRMIESASSFEDGEIQSAKDYLTKAILNAPQSLTLIRLLSRVASTLGELDLSIQCLRAYKALSPDNVGIAFDLALSFARQGKALFPSAISELEAHESSSGNEELYSLSTLLFACIGDGERAAERFEVFRGLCRQVDRIVLTDAYRHLYLGDTHAALELAKTSIEKSTFDPHVLVNWAEFFICAGSTNTAINFLEKHGFENGDPVLLLARYLESDQIDEKDVLHAWERNNEWRFFELVIFRERGELVGQPAQLMRLAIIEKLIRQNEFVRLKRRDRDAFAW